MKYVVGVSDMKVTNEQDAVIVTHALGSCIGVAIFDSTAHVGGLLHYMLPSSKKDPIKAKTKPLMFGDLAIPMLFKKAYTLGAQKKNIRVVIAGGAQVFKSDNLFDIGKRNAIIAKKMFWKNHVFIDNEAIGGNLPRTMYLNMSSGEIYYKTRGEKFIL